MAITVEILSHNLKVKSAKGRLLADVLVEAGVPVNLYCLERGVCGKCAVEFLSDPVPGFTPGEQSLLARRGWGPRFRLACRHELSRPIVISIPALSLLEEMPVLTWGAQAKTAFDPALKKYFLELAKPDLSVPDSTWDTLRKGLRIPGAAASLEVICSLPPLAGRTDGRLTAVVHEDRDILALEAGDTSANSLGLAIDLGTTTLVAELIDLATGLVVDSETSLNDQASYGADVVSRISLVFAEPGKGRFLRDSVVKGLNRMISYLLERNRRQPEDIYEAVVAGNTAMNHLLIGAPVTSLALAPYTAAYSTLPSLPVPEIGLTMNPAGRVYVAPNIKSFVGGDIAAGLLASGVLDRKASLLYVDLGTNGEIALKKGGELFVTSTAAGPAFEGMNISHGMLAAPGAIFKAEADGTGLRVFTIGDRPARGICGTGLIDVVAVGLSLGLITPQGVVSGPDKRIEIAPGIFLDQKDVRELQLASAAIKAGMRMMLAESGLRPADLDALLIAGAFGSYLNIPRAMAEGLLPSIDPDRITFLGNASLSGARLLLLSLEERRRLEAAVGSIRHYSLASRPSFQEDFIGALEFRPWS